MNYVYTQNTKFRLVSGKIVYTFEPNRKKGYGNKDIEDNFQIFKFNGSNKVESPTLNKNKNSFRITETVL